MKNKIIFREREESGMLEEIRSLASGDADKTLLNCLSNENGLYRNGPVYTTRKVQAENFNHKPTKHFIFLRQPCGG